MFHPAAASVWAVARPMPRLEPAPVTRAVLSDTDMVLLQELVQGWVDAFRCGSDGGRGRVGGPGAAVVSAAGELGPDPGDDGVGGQAVPVVQRGQSAGGEELVRQSDRHDPR